MKKYFYFILNVILSIVAFYLIMLPLLYCAGSAGK